MKQSIFVSALVATVLTVPVLAQTVNVQSGAKAQADTDVRVAPDGGVSVTTRAKAEAESSVSISADPNRAPQRQKPAQQNNGMPRPVTAAPPPQPEIIYVEVAPLPLMPDPAALPPKPRPPLPCNPIEMVGEGVKIKIVNKYCTVKISIRQVWREGGKTHVEFEADNSKGGQQAYLRLVEQWTDRSGRAVADAIGEQKIAIGKGRNVIFSVTGPTPAAVGGTLTLYKSGAKAKAEAESSVSISADANRAPQR